MTNSTLSGEPDHPDPSDRPVNHRTTARRERFSTQVRPDITERAKAAVRGVSRITGEDYSLAQLTEEALMSYTKQLEDRLNDGLPWPSVTALRRGTRRP